MSGCLRQQKPNVEEEEHEEQSWKDKPLHDMYRQQIETVADSKPTLLMFSVKYFYFTSFMPDLNRTVFGNVFRLEIQDYFQNVYSTSRITFFSMI